MSKIIAITGATGFVGSHLIKKLTESGFQVRALTRRPQKPTENITWIEGDLENETALSELIAGADVIYHLAGVVKARSYEDFASVNIHAVTRLLNIVKASKSTAHFIHLSSLTAREPQLSYYALTKFLGEIELQKNADQIPWTILRPPGIYGPGDYEILKLFKGINAHLGLIPGSRQNRMSILYVEDLVDGLIAAANEPKAFGKTLDIDDGKENGYSILEFTHMAADILNVKIVTLTVPKFLLKSFGFLNHICANIFKYTPMVTHKKANELCFSDWICNDLHASKILNWKPKTLLNSGLTKTLEWYKQNNLL